MSTTAEKPPTSRKSLTTKEKLNVLKDIEKKMTYTQIKAKFGISKACIANIKSMGGELKRMKAENQNLSYKRIFLSDMGKKIDSCVYEWYSNEKMNNNNVTGPMIQDKAREIAKGLGKEDFKGSNGWLQRFFVRHKKNDNNDDNNADSSSDDDSDIHSNYHDIITPMDYTPIHHNHNNNNSPISPTSLTNMATLSSSTNVSNIPLSFNFSTTTVNANSTTTNGTNSTHDNGINFHIGSNTSTNTTTNTTTTTTTTPQKKTTSKSSKSTISNNSNNNTMNHTTSSSSSSSTSATSSSGTSIGTGTITYTFKDELQAWHTYKDIVKYRSSCSSSSSSIEPIREWMDGIDRYYQQECYQQFLNNQNIT